ncbi:adenine deaminase [Geomicrobium sp. JCM 19039]|uniref:adenine deaminase n=1 Tax=Geomicrobium sp. JCM 19039 TaxID=1460636 RepID=UPI00045F2140|nr:adenine deaminase [Geomicrobium sp. JCM 19039]GAK10680.1 adenine deaminase [Geomicrobium sp. JCM 19039]
MYERKPQFECLVPLNETARGERKATLVIKNAKLINVVSGEILENTDVAVCESRIAYVGENADHTVGDDTEVIDANGKYLSPGFIDGHCHIESSQITPAQFARAVLPKGTTSGFFDAHEITNVLGLDGLKLMLNEARKTPMAAYMQVASCVPSTSAEFETNGASIGPKEVKEAFTWGDDMVALGEVMNFPGVVYGDEKMMGELEETLKAGRVADGHYTWEPDSVRLSAYASTGISGDHEVTTAEDVIARIRLGQYAKMRRGSAWHDVAETIKAHTEHGINTRRMMLVTDDRSPESLVDEGHMDFVIRHAIEQGVHPVVAIQMATINTAERFGLSQDVGMIAPGRFADFVLLDGKLEDVHVDATICAGSVVAENGKTVVEIKGIEWPEYATHSVNLKRDVRRSDFEIEAPTAVESVPVRAIHVQENQVGTKEKHVNVATKNNQIQLGNELCKMAIIERHGINGNTGLGILSGVGFQKPSAIAMTVAHDSHNLMVIGNDDDLMAQAANHVASHQGGIAFVSGDEVTMLPLPVAGLMSDQPYEEVANTSKKISEKLAEAGCTMNYAFMTLSLLALVVIPEIRLSDTGLVRIGDQGFEKVGLFVD